MPFAVCVQHAEELIKMLLIHVILVLVVYCSVYQTKLSCLRCGECVGCLTEMDCRKCRFCRDMTKYGGRGSLRQKCIKRQCLRYSRILHAEDPIYTTKVAPVIQEELEAGLRAVGGNTSSPRHEDQLVDVERPDIDFRMITEPTEEEYLPPPAKKKVSIVKKGKTPGKGGVSKGGTKGKPGGKGRTVKPKKKTRLSTSDFDFDELVGPLHCVQNNYVALYYSSHCLVGGPDNHSRILWGVVTIVTSPPSSAMDRSVCFQPDLTLSTVVKSVAYSWQ